MEISFSILYYIYLMLIGVFIVFSFFNLYHLLRFGSPRLISLSAAILYLIISLLILAASWSYVSTIDWSQSMSLFPQNFNFSTYE